MAALAPVALQLVEQVLDREAGERRDAEALAEAVERASARLHERLAGLIGQAGFAALLSRSLRLAQADFPLLAGVTIDAGVGGYLRGVREVALTSADDPAVVGAALAAIPAQLIGLLVIFIGEDLAVQLVREAWPELAQDADTAEVRL